MYHLNEEEKTEIGKLLHCVKVVSCDPLGDPNTGMVNAHIHFVGDTGDGKTESYVIRRYSERTLTDRDSEYVALKYLQNCTTKDTIPSKISPRVFLYDESEKVLKGRYLVMEFVDGKALKFQEATDDVLCEMAKMLRILHSLKFTDEIIEQENLSVLKKRRSLKQKLRLFPEEWIPDAFLKSSKGCQEIMKAHKQENLHTDAKKFFNLGLSVTKKLIESEKFVKLPRNYLIHGDSHVGNVMLEKNTKKYIYVDWEASKFESFYEDLAIVVVVAFLKGERMGKFLKCYQTSFTEATGGEKEKNIFEKVEIDLEMLEFYKIRCLGRICAFFMLKIAEMIEKKIEPPVIYCMGLSMYFNVFKGLVTNFKCNS